MSCKVKIGEVRRFIVDCLKAAGANETPAMQQAELLVQADRTGHQSHGLNRLERYVTDIKEKVCLPNNEPQILKESRSTAWVDARNCMGATASQFGVDLAMKKARDTGVGWVSMKGSNHNGMLGYWAKLCAKRGFIGLAFTNSAPVLTPTRSKKAALGTNPLAIVAPADDKEFFYLEMATTAVSVGAIEMRRRAGKEIPLGWALGPDGTETTDPELRSLGTNPIAMAAPAAGGEKIVVDMATTTVALGKIEMQVHKEEPLPTSWALGPDGKPTTDAKEAYSTAMLMPLGGEEISGGYKGYCLASMVETFCSGLSGSTPTHETRQWDLSDSKEPMNLGQCFVAIDPSCFAPGFGERIAEYLKIWRSLEPVDPSLPVLVPGDKERIVGEKTLSKGTVCYPPNQLEVVETMAKKIGVKPIEVVKSF